MNKELVSQTKTCQTWEVEQYLAGIRMLCTYFIKFLNLNIVSVMNCIFSRFLGCLYFYSSHLSVVNCLSY